VAGDTTVGVPEITQFDGFMDNPVGKEGEIEQVTVVPPALKVEGVIVRFK
jgi:hypothetical protein